MIYTSFQWTLKQHMLQVLRHRFNYLVLFMCGTDTKRLWPLTLSSLPFIVHSCPSDVKDVVSSMERIQTDDRRKEGRGDCLPVCFFLHKYSRRRGRGREGWVGVLGWAAKGGGWCWCPVGGVPEDLWLTCRHLTHPLARHAPSPAPSSSVIPPYKAKLVSS